MKRLFVILVLVLAFAQIAQAQEPEKVYLPVIFSGDCTMTTGILAVSDGTTTIDLHNLSVGIGLKEWNPTVTPHETTSQQSPLADMKRPVSRRFSVATETLTFNIKNITEDQLYVQIQELERLLEKAVNYWTTDVQPDPVYLVVRGNCETNTRYAIIYDYSFPQLDDPMSPDFTTIDGKIFDELTLNIERGHWLANAPGTGTCGQTNNEQVWWSDQAWSVRSTDPSLQVLAIIQASSGRLFLGDVDSQVLQSDDDGLTWQVSTAAPASAVSSLFQTSTGRILAGVSGRIWYSDDNGGTWNNVIIAGGGIITSIIQTETGRLVAADTTDIVYSDNDGANWTAIPVTTKSILVVLQTTTGRILAADNGQIWYSDDNALTWNILTTDPSGFVYSLYQTTTGRILAGNVGEIWFSDNDGDSWSVTGSALVGNVEYILQSSTGAIYAGENGQIWKSGDDGDTWTVETTLPSAFVFTIMQTTTGRILAGDDGQVLTLPYTTFDMGPVNTCDDSVYVVNQARCANLTHIFVDDGGVFGANLLPMTVFPVTLLPAVPVVNDAIYFGINTAIVDSGPFDGLVIDLDSVIQFDTSYTITWEVWTGAVWVALTVHDGTNPGTGAFRSTGVSSVHWVRPTGWATTAVNGVTGYWVRARLSALVGAITPPTQQNRNIYSPTFPYVEVDSTQVVGDIAAIAEVKAHNRSDQDGPGGSGPDLYDNRLIMGLRSTERGSAFSSYLNVSNEQNPFGVTVTAGATTTIDADVSAPTGWRGTFAPAGVEAMLTRITFTLGPTIARDYYGTYHAFVRANRTAGAAADIGIRLQISAGSGGVIYTTETKYLQTTTIFELLDFGQVSIPPAGVLKTTELGDSTEIRIQASAASGTPDLRLYDLILIPVDEYAIDAVDKANETDSDVGRSGSKDKYLNLDSLTNPKENIRALVQIFGSGFVTSIYGPIAPGELFLQANKEQRLWFLAAKTSATGTAFYWISPPEISHSIQILKNERYLSVRGNR